MQTTNHQLIAARSVLTLEQLQNSTNYAVNGKALKGDHAWPGVRKTSRLATQFVIPYPESLSAATLLTAAAYMPADKPALMMDLPAFYLAKSQDAERVKISPASITERFRSYGNILSGTEVKEGLITRLSYQAVREIDPDEHLKTKIGFAIPESVKHFETCRSLLESAMGMKPEEFAILYRIYNSRMQQEAYYFLADAFSGLQRDIGRFSPFTRLALLKPFDHSGERSEWFRDADGRICFANTVDLRRFIVRAEWLLAGQEEVNPDKRNVSSDSCTIDAKFKSIYQLTKVEDHTGNLQDVFQLKRIEITGRHRKLLAFICSHGLDKTEDIRALFDAAVQAKEQGAQQEFESPASPMSQFYQRHWYKFAAARGLLFAGTILACLLVFDKRSILDILTNEDASAAILAWIGLGCFVVGWHSGKLVDLLCACAAGLMRLGRCSTAAAANAVSSPMTVLVDNPDSVTSLPELFARELPNAKPRRLFKPLAAPKPIPALIRKAEASNLLPVSTTVQAVAPMPVALDSAAGVNLSAIPTPSTANAAILLGKQGSRTSVIAAPVRPVRRERTIELGRLSRISEVSREFSSNDLGFVV